MTANSRMISAVSYLPRIAGVAALCLIALSAPCSVAGTDADQIVIKDFMFAPVRLTVRAGSTVSWINQDDEPHTVVSDAGLFRSSAVDTGEHFSFKFERPGTYHFTCSIHPRMVGTIVVE
jgi:plastocyanin